MQEKTPVPQIEVLGFGELGTNLALSEKRLVPCAEGRDVEILYQPLGANPSPSGDPFKVVE
jgi:hypothetical protein